MSVVVPLTVNGEERVIGASLGSSLLEVLRSAGLTGTKGACEQGECGSCSVLLDGDLVCSCLVPASVCSGVDVVTIEGVMAPDLAEALARHGAVQCGFCTPGIVMSALSYLDAGGDDDPTAVRDALAGNLCRCTGYAGIVSAVCEVARGRR